MIRVCLDDAHVDLLHLAAEDFSRGETPASRSFLCATMTALSKKDGGIRGIATGSSFRRLVGKTLARQFGAVFEQVCAPFQFAVCTRAGTDRVGHTIRVMIWMHAPQFSQWTETFDPVCQEHVQLRPDNTCLFPWMTSAWSRRRRGLAPC